VRRIALICITAAACGRTGAGLAPGPDPDAWLAPCEAGLARAAHAPSWQRGRIVVDACRPCGVAWDPVLADPVPPPSKVIAVVDACKLDCPAKARSDLFAAISAAESDAPARNAWLAFGKACPAAMGTPGKDGRYASGAWFALQQIGRALARAHETPSDLTVALPLWSQVGSGYALPPASAAPTELDMPIITINDATAFIVRDPPRARFGAGGVEAIGDAWPGEHLDGIDVKLARYSLVAPAKMPADRIAARTQELGAPTTIVTQAPGRGLFGGEVAGKAVP
jgi:hypothetical protein